MNTKMNAKRMGSDIQSTFLASVKSRLPMHLSLPDELAELLHISRDSAYRRIREETLLSLSEAKILCHRYNVSLDSLMSRDSGNVLFEFKAQLSCGTPIKSWLESILAHLKAFESATDANLIWHFKDLPVIHFFQCPRLAAFKLWMNLPADGGNGKEVYKEGAISKDLIALGERIWATYSRLPSTEIFSRELMNTTLRQIEYGYDSGLLSRGLAAALCKDSSDLIQLLECQIRQGNKKQDESQPPAGKFEAYVNELLIGDNTILFQAGEKQTAFVTHNNFNILGTADPSFCRQTEAFMKSIIQKSVLVSRVAERQRTKFFNRIYREIDEVQALLGPDRIAC